MEPLKDVCRLGNLALVLADLGEELGEACALNFDVDLALSDLEEGINQGQLDLHRGGLLNEHHGFLDHLGNGLLQLTALLGKQHDLLVEHLPILGLETHLHGLHQHPGGRRKVSRLRKRKRIINPASRESSKFK